MNKMKLILMGLTLGLMTATALEAQTRYRCLVQMNAYQGEKAYVVVSLINPKGEYAKTLRVMGPDKRWYDSLASWHKAQKAKPEQLDAVTGASIAGGDRSVFTLQLDDSLLDKGYTIRFESSVEDKRYYERDAIVEVTQAKLQERTAGSGYIRAVKLTAVGK